MNIFYSSIKTFLFSQKFPTNRKTFDLTSHKAGGWKILLAVVNNFFINLLRLLEIRVPQVSNLLLCMYVVSVEWFIQRKFIGWPTALTVFSNQPNRTDWAASVFIIFETLQNRPETIEIELLKSSKNDESPLRALFFLWPLGDHQN